MATMRLGDSIDLEGWLFEEGRIRNVRNKQYLRLHNSRLSLCESPDSKPMWTENLANCSFDSDNSHYELSVTFPHKKLSFFADTPEEFAAWSVALKKASCSAVEDFYTIGKLLGEGAFAQVRLAVDRETGDRFAIKIIKKKEFDAKDTEYVMREVSIMKSISHPSIVGTYDVFDSATHFYIVLEFMEGGELFDIIADAGHLSEQAASQVMRDVVVAVQYLHTQSIVHRDIKPENVLCKSKTWPLTVKLADFGLANFSEDGAVIESADGCVVGTPGYVAPEVVKREKYGPAVDMWACGVLLYIMLSGKMPFYGRDDYDCLRKIARAEYTFPTREWNNVSPKAVSLVKSLLQVDPDKRLTADSALHHEWLADPNALSREPIANDLSGIHSSRRKFRKAVNAAITLGRLMELSGVSAFPSSGASAHDGSEAI